MSSQRPIRSELDVSRRLKRSLVLVGILAVMAALIGIEIWLVFGHY